MNLLSLSLSLSSFVFVDILMPAEAKKVDSPFLGEISDCLTFTASCGYERVDICGYSEFESTMGDYFKKAIDPPPPSSAPQLQENVLILLLWCVFYVVLIYQSQV